jgi:hypothetical protein
MTSDTDLDATFDQLGARGVDVGDDQLQAVYGAWRSRRDPAADGD